ncbi:ASCH domain-containing protein [Nonomuraea turkmeniaca]|uniref:ASCH domain-containing protein n=1 Tax=Nonomuraea turkmeniaca TaxID=103838 RepID=A0A5S4FAQ1_9ACTN|nr:ASCH domain-containing protein [Nonomuraea turkmeniaca]TMR14309.1 ASCH domain-containing protein [Nonomuraea turkmeniaca]
MWPRMDGLRVLELGTPGELRTRLTALALSGEKTATAGLLALDYHAEGEEVEHVGEHLILAADTGGRAAEIEIVRVELTPFPAVTSEFAQAEGEGYRSTEDWRESHRRYWSAQGYEVGDSSTVVCLWFRVAPFPRQYMTTRAAEFAGVATLHGMCLCLWC